MQIKTLPFRIWLTLGSANSSLENMTEDVAPHRLSEVGNGNTSVSLD